MDVTISKRLYALVGADASIATDASGIPRVAPRTDAACALVLKTASEAGWRVRLAGAEQWCPPDGPADLILSAAGLVGQVEVRPADLVATAPAGISSDDLRQVLADHGVWLAVDAPGVSRTLGSLIATGTTGPLRTGFGSIRDHLLGLSLVTPDGRIVKAGGRVVKNVAGFDLTKLAIGSFGAFGLITSAHFRLRAIPRADLTLTAQGDRDALIEAALTILEQGLAPAALEVWSPVAGDTDRWVLGVRLIGADASIAHDRDIVMGSVPLVFAEAPASEAATVWTNPLARAIEYPVTLRLGTLRSALDDAVDYLCHHLDEGWIMISVGASAIRWSGTAPVERIRLLRHVTAQLEMPLTIERAPWPIRSELGHFGAYREGVNRLVTRLRRTFDPSETLVVPLGQL